MLSLIIFVVCFSTLLFSSNAQFQTDFCKIECDNGQTKSIHTVCQRKFECGPEAACEEIPSDQAFRDSMVRVHNDFRNFIANGSNIQTVQYINPGAKNMHALSYDLELEYVAKCWINTCVTGDHDQCRDISRFSVGQNIYWAQKPDIEQAMSQESITLWFEEGKFMSDLEWIKKFPGIQGFPNDNIPRAHFTQVVWAETKLVGCARIRFKADNTQGTLICNYGPAGNVVGEPIYQVAENPADIGSACAIRNKEWKGLCGEVVPVKENGFVTPTAAPSPTSDGTPDLPSQRVFPDPTTTNKPETPDCSNEQGLTPAERELCRRKKFGYANEGCCHRNCIIFNFLIIFSYCYDLILKQ